MSGARSTDEATMVRVAWNSLAEPGDRIAGLLINVLGARRSWDMMQTAVREGDATPILVGCVDAGAIDQADAPRWADALDSGMARWAPRLDSVDVPRVLDAANRVGARCIVPGDVSWPTGLDALGTAAPVVLWCRSGSAPDAGVLARRAVAVVGSRVSTLYGTECAAEIAERMVETGLAVCSGGAYGIDAAAHRAALATDGPTVAVLAGGADRLYPAGNTELLRRIIATGVVVAESPPGTRPTRWRFLARNRVIAAMSDVTVVVEAGLRSGALNTAHHAAELGRPVFAVPGPMTSASSTGCHRLVATGRAELLVRVDDVVACLAPLGYACGSDASLFDGFTDPDVTRAVDAVGSRRGVPIVEIARRSGLAVAATESAIALAAVQGVVERDGNGWRVCRRPAH